MKHPKQKLADVRKSISSKQLSPSKALAITGGDGGFLYPWIDRKVGG